MSIEQKIADLLEEANKLEVEQVAEEISTEEFNALDEETQGLYELSVDTMNSYRKKAQGDIDSKIKSKSYVAALDRAGHSATASQKIKAKGGTPVQRESVKEAEYTVDMSEDIEALTNGEELSEEFKTKAATIFEAAVVTRVKSEVARLAEEFDAQLDEQVESIKEGLVEKVDGYLNYVVEQWMTDNELALESGMKNEILESFVSSMKGVFEQHYIEVPEEKFDVLGEMQQKTDAATAKLDEQLAMNVALSKQLNEMKRTASISEFAAGMADTDAEKFKALAEELAYDEADTFKAKLQTIKENYFGKKQNAPMVQSVVTDAPVALTEEVVHTPQMAQYLRTLSNMKK